MSDQQLSPHNLAELHTHRSEKWRGFPQDVLPLPVAEMDFPVADPIKALRQEIQFSLVHRFITTSIPGLMKHN